ncbi:hypothetical protein DMC47_16310 [Nostoc sp. 3335mG]|nr:hypothetical protein DMC47_16310 [Nostoc sp. 3335mG]
MLAEFEAFISYAQINIFRPEQPQFNLWTPEHDAQGFAWREGSVSFGVPDHDGTVWVEIDLRPTAKPVDATALRAVTVPFLVGNDGAVYSALDDDRRLDIPAGSYAVQYELLPGFERDEVDYAYRLVVTFSPDPQPGFAILRNDAEVTATEVLSTTATPAM